jgi:hypothetical protein
MIEFVLATVVSTSPYDWQMSCEQTLEAVQTVLMDEWFAKPENLQDRGQLIKKLRSHGPQGCVPLEL